MYNIYNFNQRKRRYNMSRWLTALAIVVLSIFIESICFLVQPVNITHVLEQLTSHPIIFLLNLMPILILNILIFILCKNTFFSAAAVSVISFSASLINRFKIIYYDDPFMPLDIFNGSSATTGKAAINTIRYDFVMFVVCILVIALLIAAGIFIKSYKFNAFTKVSITVLTICFALIINTLVYSSTSLYEKLPVQTSKYTSGVFNDLGFIYSFLYNFNTSRIEQPDNYNKKYAQELIKAHSTEKAKVPNIKSNVIFIVSEAFSDLSTYKPFIITEANDPLKNYSRISLMRNSISGHIIVPGNSGETANAEYDILTGMQTSYLNSKGTSAFNMIRKNLSSIPRFFTENGYADQLIYPGEGWMYNRSNVYKFLGLSNQVLINSFKKPDNLKGDNISDYSLAKMIVQKYKDNYKTKEVKPWFCYAVSTQNSAPYTADKYNYKPVEVETFRKEIPDESKNKLNTYFEGVRDSDSMLNVLVNYFMNSDTPTIIVFVGNHLPFTGDDADIYKELGINFDERGSMEQIYNSSRLPFLIWANETAYNKTNFEAAKKKLDLPKDNTINANYLGPVLLELLGFKGQDSYYDFLNDVRRDLPVIDRYYAKTEEGFTKVLNDNQMQKYNALKNWQYFKINSEVIEKR